MSQQAQADGIQQQGVQNEGELVRDIEALQAKHRDDEITGEALATEIEALETRASTNETNFREADRLSTLRDRAVTLSSRAVQPDWSRPAVETEPESGPQTLSGPPPEEGGSSLTGDLAPGGIARDLLNQVLRPASFGGGRESLNAAGWQYLQRPRSRVAFPSSEFLSSNRGDMLALTPFVDSSGGWIQAEEVWREIVTLRDRASGLESMVRTIDLVGPRLAIPTMKVVVTFTKRSKSAPTPADTPIDLSKIIGRTSLTAHPKDALLKIPEEFFEDPAFDAVGEIVRAADRDSREQDETDILVGDGSGEPVGIVPTVQKLYAEGATHIGLTPAGGTDVFTADEIKVFDTFLHANAMSMATWIINRVGLRKFRLFRTEPDGAGSGDYLFERNEKAGAMPTFLERPVLVSEFLPDTITSGSEGDVMWLLMNTDDYWLLRQKVLKLRILAELFAVEHQVGYQWVKSRDGALVAADGIVFARRGA